MKRALIALTALTFAAPAVAQQIAPGTDAAREFFAQDNRTSNRDVYIDGADTVSDEALAQAEREIQSENGNGAAMPMFNTDTNQVANAEAARILNNIAAEEEGGI